MTGSASQRISWKRLIKLAVWYALDSMVCLIPVRPRPGRVIVLRLDKIGDFLIWLDAARALTRHYQRQGKRVTVAADSSWAGWAAHLGVFDDVISVSVAKFESDLRYRFAMSLKVRRFGASVAVLPAYSRSWAAGDTLVRVSGATERIGSVGDPENTSKLERRLGDRWYTRLIPAQSSPIMELERNAEFTAGITGQALAPRVSSLRELSPQVPLPAAVAALDTPTYVIFPSTSAGAKCWPVDRFREIAERIHAETGWIGVVCGGPGDVALGQRLCAGSTAPLIDLSGKTSLAELTVVIASSRVVVANDTSAIHIAASVSIPSVCVLGGGHVGRFLPYSERARGSGVLPVVVTHPMPCFNCHWNCIFDVPKGLPKPCVTNISADDVWAQVLPLLKS